MVDIEGILLGVFISIFAVFIVVWSIGILKWKQRFNRIVCPCCYVCRKKRKHHKNDDKKLILSSNKKSTVTTDINNNNKNINEINTISSNVNRPQQYASGIDNSAFIENERAMNYSYTNSNIDEVSVDVLKI